MLSSRDLAPKTAAHDDDLSDPGQTSLEDNTLTSVWRIGNVLLSIHLLEEQVTMLMNNERSKFLLRTAGRSRSKYVRTKTHGSSQCHSVGLRDHDGDTLNTHSELWSVLGELYYGSVQLALLVRLVVFPVGMYQRGLMQACNATSTFLPYLD